MSKNVVNSKSVQVPVRIPIPVRDFLKQIATENIDNINNHVATEVNAILLREYKAWKAYKEFKERRRAKLLKK